jgi:hypothetical protein
MWDHCHQCLDETRFRLVHIFRSNEMQASQALDRTVAVVPARRRAPANNSTYGGLGFRNSLSLSL